MSKGIKHDNQKSRMDLLPYEALEQISKVLTFGANKYGKANWANGIEHSRLIAAAMRHLGQHNSGENADSESGISHIAHAACNLVFLLWMIKNRPDLDDRWEKSIRSSELVPVSFFKSTDVIKVDAATIHQSGHDFSKNSEVYRDIVDHTMNDLTNSWGPGKFGGKL